MANEGEPSQPRRLSLEQAHEIRKDNAIMALQEQVEKHTRELEQVKGYKQ